MSLAVSRRLTLALLLASAGLTPGLTPGAAALQGVPPATELPLQRATSLLDAPIFGLGGHALGRVYELVIAGSGEVTVLVQSRERGLVGVPLSRLQFEPYPGPRATPGRFVLQVSADVLLRSPTLVASEDAADEAWLGRLARHYGLETGAASPTTEPEFARTPLLLRRLLGDDVVTADGVTSGTVLDLMVDVAAASVPLLIVTEDGAARDATRLQVDWDQLGPERELDRVHLACTQAELESALPFASPAPSGLAARRP